MSAALHLANIDDLDRLEPLVAAYQQSKGTQSTPEHRYDALRPLLQGSPHGVAYLIGMRRAPVGYISISFGYSIELGGIVGAIGDFFIRESVRGRGMGTEVLAALTPALAEHGVKALHTELDLASENAQRIFHRAGFQVRDGFHQMTKRL